MMEQYTETKSEAIQEKQQTSLLFGQEKQVFYKKVFNKKQNKQMKSYFNKESLNYYIRHDR